MTTRGELRDQVASILLGATDAGAEVYTPADWPSTSAQYPVVLVAAPREDRVSIGRATVEFTATAVVRILAKVRAAAAAQDYGAQLAEVALERLERQILGLVINNPALRAKVQQFAFVRTDSQVSAEGEQHTGELVIEIGLEYYAGPEDFWPDAAVPLTEVTVTDEPSGRPLLDLHLPTS